MSLAAEAVAKHEAIRSKENDSTHNQDRARYVELMLRGIDSEEAQQELSNLLFYLDDASPPLTPSDVLRHEHCLVRARELMLLAADATEATAEAAHASALVRAMQQLARETPRFMARVMGDADTYQDQCSRAVPELQQLADQYPEFFEHSADGTPYVIGSDPASTAKQARRTRLVQSVYCRLNWIDDALLEIEDMLAATPDDHEQRLFRELWQAERQRDRSNLETELQAVGGDVAGYESFRAAQPERYRPLNRDFVPAHPDPAEELRAAPPATDATGDVDTSDDTAVSEEQATAEYANNEGAASAALGLSDDEWRLLRQDDSFPKRTSKGWDLVTIRLWLEIAADKEPEPDAVKDPAAVDDAAAA